MAIVQEECNDSLQNPYKHLPQPNLVTLKEDAACLPQRRNKFIILDLKLSPCSVCCGFFLGNSPASGYYMPTFRNTICSIYTDLPMKMERMECFETSAYKIQTPGNYPEENIQQSYYPVR
jgi:hypothetical protein